MRPILKLALLLAAHAAVPVSAEAARQLEVAPVLERPATGHLNLVTEHRVSASGAMDSIVSLTFSASEYRAYKKLGACRE